MNRLEFQTLAHDRLLDAEALLVAGRWSGAYYIAGYALECALKSCVLLHIMNTGVVFQGKRFAERCWTHNLEDLLGLAKLDAVLGPELSANPALQRNWLTAKDWSETSRYQQITQAEAELLVRSIADPKDGILAWIMKRW